MSYSRHQPASKVPDTTQAMWEVAFSDFTQAEILLNATRASPEATPDIIARRELQWRTRRGICNAINFLITNQADVNAVIAAKKNKRAG